MKRVSLTGYIRSNKEYRKAKFEEMTAYSKWAEKQSRLAEIEEKLIQEYREVYGVEERNIGGFSNSSR